MKIRYIRITRKDERQKKSPTFQPSSGRYVTGEEFWRSNCQRFHGIMGGFDPQKFNARRNEQLESWKWKPPAPLISVRLLFVQCRLAHFFPFLIQHSRIPNNQVFTSPFLYNYHLYFLIVSSLLFLGKCRQHGN